MKKWIQHCPLWVFVVAFVPRLTMLLYSVSLHSKEFFYKVFFDTHVYVNSAQTFLGNRVELYDQALTPPGYAWFMAFHFALFGDSPYPLLFSQLILSSLSAVWVYYIALEVFSKLNQVKLLALFSALLFALFPTGWTLTLALLTETLFIFLFTSSLVLFLWALKKNSMRLMVGMCLLLSGAVYTRTILQFWPLALCLYLVLTKKQYPQINLTKMVGLIVGVTYALLILWPLRNYSNYNKFFFALVSTETLVNNLVADACRLKWGAPNRNMVRKKFMAEEKAIRELHGPVKGFIKGRSLTLKKYAPLCLKEMIQIYPDRIYHNLTEPDYLHRSLLGTKKIVLGGRHWYKTFQILALLGFIILLAQRQVSIFLFFAMGYSYFTLLSGMTIWQGSRIFFSAAPFYAPLMAITLAFAFSFFSRKWRIPKPIIKAK